ncbi:MAG: hypothetical protein Faunusvirus48_5 [Faunusvirus sp.]|jgi:protein disulfide isomerase family A protein 3|uniref:Thioredoxin domain-containing protein n=1 Tax=Faunusvirus sp. TaxID=2487766 RepID=A0A3G4ZY41_9VIRU|nr:MAG: hypothetical protein Faunusvirus48_5 [Faunusvirus sp.]
MFTLPNKKYVLIVLAIIILSCSCLYLTSANVERLDNSKPSIINFNTSWCGHSRNFVPIWTDFAASMSGKNINVTDIKCDEEKNADTCNKYAISGYPTVKLINGSQQYLYSGPRTVEGLTDFVKNYIPNL